MRMRAAAVGRLFAALSLLAAAGCSEASAPAAKPEAAGAPADAAPISGTVWQVDYANSRLGFSGDQAGEAFEGEFRTYDAKIVFDPDDLGGTQIDVTVDMSSAKTGDRQRDSALPGSDWFKAKEFPTARYVATKVEKQADGSFVADGDLTIRGVTKRVALPFTLTIEGETATARGEARILRTDFGVGQGEFADGTWVGLEVKVAVDIRAAR